MAEATISEPTVKTPYSV